MNRVSEETILWKIERLDGVTLGFSNFSYDIEFGGITYHASVAVSASEVEAVLGVGAEHGELAGGLDHDLITREDILSGRYRGAKVEQFLYNRVARSRGRLLFVGKIGKIELVGNSFRAELDSSFEQLNQVFGRSFRKECDAQFCDKQCGLEVEDYQFIASVLHVDGNEIWIEKPETGLSFQFGTFESLVGTSPAIGIREARNDAMGLKLKLWEAPLREIGIGQSVRVTAGCNKTFLTCRNQFKNAINFRGFPHMPGEKILNANAS